MATNLATGLNAHTGLGVAAWDLTTTKDISTGRDAMTDKLTTVENRRTEDGAISGTGEVVLNKPNESAHLPGSAITGDDLAALENAKAGKNIVTLGAIAKEDHLDGAPVGGEATTKVGDRKRK